MRSQASHLALDQKQQRFTVHRRDGLLAIHDNKTEKEHVLYSEAKTMQARGLTARQMQISSEFPTFDAVGNRHSYEWCGQDAVHLADWLNWRNAGYPPVQYLHGRPVL